MNNGLNILLTVLAAAVLVFLILYLIGAMA